MGEKCFRLGACEADQQARRLDRKRRTGNLVGYHSKSTLHLDALPSKELAELECLNNGKPIKVARDFDIGDSVQCLRYYAGWADKITGEVRSTL